MKKKVKTKKRKPLIGQVGNYVVSLRRVENLNQHEELLDGRARVNTRTSLAEMEIDSVLTGIALLDTLCHEQFHVASDIYGLNLSHSKIYTLSSALTSFLISSGIVREGELERRLAELETGKK